MVLRVVPPEEQKGPTWIIQESWSNADSERHRISTEKLPSLVVMLLEQLDVFFVFIIYKHNGNWGGTCLLRLSYHV